jgi:SAM-dependent methyltransferase
MALRVPLEYAPCPLCGSRDAEEMLSAPDPTGVVEGEFRIARCRACGMGFLNPRPPPEALAACYSGDYAPHRSPESQRARRLSLADRLVLRIFYGWPFGTAPARRPRHAPALARALLAPLRGRFDRDRKNIRFLPFEGGGGLLDVGCGSGAWLALHAEGGFAAAGIEPDPHAAERARVHRGLAVHTGTIHDAPYPRESFDAVNLSHVLEHVPDPRETLSAARDFLVSGGLLALSIPVIDGHAARRLGPHWRHLELPRHLLHFPRPVLLRCLAECGFRVERVRDDPAGDGWRESFTFAPEALRSEPWFAALARSKRRRRRLGRELAARGESSFVVVHARK